MRRAAFLAVLLMILGCFTVAAEEKPPAAASFGGALFRTLFNDPSASFRVEGLDATAYSALPDTLKARLMAYAERYAAFRSRLTPPDSVGGLVPTPAARALYTKRQSLERAIVALSDSTGIEDRAAAYAARAPLFHDGKTRSEHVLAEAVAAEKDLDTPGLRSYLLIFLLHRYRCAYEFSTIGGDIHEAKLVSQKYQAVLRQARAHPDPLVQLMAEDLDRYPRNLMVDSRMTGGDIHP